MNHSDYYMRACLYTPPMFENREFAIIIPGKDASIRRHLSFKNVDKLRAFLIEHASAHVYFSSAKYEYPEIEPMETKKKYWLGSDLVFDIDDVDLKRAKRNVLKLLRILKQKFGLEKMMCAFSGRRGYHVHVHDQCIQSLTSPERRQIADYFCMPLKPGTNKKNKNYVPIDAQVTGDFTRLMRLPGSYHTYPSENTICKIIDLE